MEALSTEGIVCGAALERKPSEGVLCGGAPAFKSMLVVINYFLN